VQCPAYTSSRADALLPPLTLTVLLNPGPRGRETLEKE
jgi:hypothetical protein